MDNPFKLVNKSFKKPDLIPAGYYQGSLSSIEIKMVKDKENPTGPKVPKILWSFGVSNADHAGVITLWTSTSTFELGRAAMTLKSMAPDIWDPTMAGGKDREGDADKMWAHAQSLIGRELNLYISVNEAGYNKIDSIAPTGPSPKKKKELTPFEAPAPGPVEDDINF